MFTNVRFLCASLSDVDGSAHEGIVCPSRLISAIRHWCRLRTCCWIDSSGPVPWNGPSGRFAGVVPSRRAGKRRSVGWASETKLVEKSAAELAEREQLVAVEWREERKVPSLENG